MRTKDDKRNDTTFSLSLCLSLRISSSLPHTVVSSMKEVSKGPTFSRERERERVSHIHSILVFSKTVLNRLLSFFVLLHLSFFLSPSFFFSPRLSPSHTLPFFRTPSPAPGLVSLSLSLSLSSWLTVIWSVLLTPTAAQLLFHPSSLSPSSSSFFFSLPLSLFLSLQFSVSSIFYTIPPQHYHPHQKTRIYTIIHRHKFWDRELRYTHMTHMSYWASNSLSLSLCVLSKRKKNMWRDRGRERKKERERNVKSTKYMYARRVPHSRIADFHESVLLPTFFLSSAV